MGVQHIGEELVGDRITAVLDGGHHGLRELWLVVSVSSTSAKTIRTPPVASSKTSGKNAAASWLVTAWLAAS
jgi:hypothetical protein